MSHVCQHGRILAYCKACFEERVDVQMLRALERIEKLLQPPKVTFYDFTPKDDPQPTRPNPTVPGR